MDELNKKKLKSMSTSDEIWVNKFDEESAQEFREAVLEEASGDPKKPIVVYIDSYGGFVDALAKMIETLDEVPNPIITVCMGKAMSCGAVLLSHGDIRFCGKHSRVMIHETSSGTAGDVNDVKADAKEADRLNKWFMGLLAKNCGLKGGYDGIRKIIKDRDGRDIYLDADAALKFGIVDAIGLPHLEQGMSYSVSMVQPKVSLRKDPHSKKLAKKTSKKSDSKKR
jgi:ATP-dependent Clp protease protease subunit